jgi:hypothetical protein
VTASERNVMTQLGREELRPYLRDERPPDDSIVHLPRAGQLRCAGFQLLPSFGRPHYTIRLEDGGQAWLARLLDALGPTDANKYHRRERQGRKPQ